jgi:integrase
VRLVLALALVGEVVAVAAQKPLPWSVQDHHPPAAACSRADEPGSLPTEAARRPLQRYHDLRHTCATLLLSRGHHPKLVQELLGHASVAMTLDRYSYVLPGMGDQTAAAMEAALS